MKAGLSGALNAESTFFAAIASRAQKLVELKQAGKLPADLVEALEKQLGIDSQVKHEDEAAKEAEAIANEVDYAGGESWSEENPGPNGETFSLAALRSGGFPWKPGARVQMGHVEATVYSVQPNQDGAGWWVVFDDVERVLSSSVREPMEPFAKLVDRHTTDIKTIRNGDASAILRPRPAVDDLKQAISNEAKTRSLPSPKEIPDSGIRYQQRKLGPTADSIKVGDWLDYEGPVRVTAIEETGMGDRWISFGAASVLFGDNTRLERASPPMETFSLRAPFTPPAFITRKYNERLDQWEKTGDAGRELINLGFTPPVLQLAGADNLSLVIPPSLFNKVTKDVHAVPVEALRALPKSLADPVAVFQSRTRADSLVVLTEHAEAGKPIIVAVTLDKSAGKNWQVNEVASMYGKNDAGAVAAMFGESPLYVNEKKSLAWSRLVGLQLPKRPTPQRGQGSIPGPEDVVKWAEEKLKAQGGETFSIRSGDFQSRMAAAFSPFQKSPEVRMAVAQVAKQRALKLGAEWIEKAAVLRSAGNISKEARMREALAYETRMNEYLDGLTPEARQALEWEPADLADDPLVSAMLDHGKLMSRTTALQQDKLTLKNGDYDGVPWLPPSWYSKGAGIMPDQMAQAMHDAGLLPDDYTDTLWSELSKRIEASRKDKAAYWEAQNGYKDAVKYARDASRAESEKWAEQARKEAGSPANQRAMLKAALRTLDGILAAAPPEVRAKVGGYVKLAGLATDEAMLKEIESRIEKLNVELEKWLRKEGIAQLEKLLKKGRPSAESGKKAKGKDADMHHLFAAAAKAAEMDETAVAGELARLDALIDGGTLTSEQEVLATTERGLVELLGDLYPRSVDRKRIYDGAESARIFAAIDALRDIYEGAWLKWKLKEIERKERRAGLRQDLITDTGKRGVKAERDAMDAESKTLLGKVKGGALSLSSFHEVLSYAFGAQSERVRALVDAEREASGQYEDLNQELADEIEQFFAKLAGGSVLDGERLRYRLAQRTIKTGKGELSQLEAIQALLMWRQEQGRQHMEGTRNENGDITSSWAYDQAWIDEIEDVLSYEARLVMAWIGAKYGAEYAALNPLYRERYGVNLPGHDNYAPITVAPQQTKAGEVVDPVSGAAISSGSVLTPGSLRTRARNVVAEPQFRDALQVFVAHTRQLEYWKAYYDLATEANAILGNREVLNAVHAKGGPEAAAALRKWVDAIAQGGFRDAAATLAVNNFIRQMSNNAATVALLGRVSTLLVQSTQLAAASVQMPVGAYLSRLGKLLSGNLGWKDAIKSEFIQRRYKAAPPIVRQAMEGLADAKKPNIIKSWASSLGKLLSGADALFTAGTYAILLDYHRSTGRALGYAGAELEQWAHTEAARDTEQVAQPTRMATRSLAEITNTNPLAKTAWAFASESRQKIALFAWSLAEWKTEPTKALKTGLLVFGVGGLMTQVIKNVWREMKSDDDEEKWSPQRLVTAALSQPFQGIPGVAQLMGESSLLATPRGTASAMDDILKGEGDMRDVETVISAAGYFNDTAAGVASLAHLGFDFAKLLTNALDD